MGEAAGRPLIVGHRGARAEAPENTLAGFDHAAAAGADMVEFDVWSCLGGEVVVIHDGAVSGQAVGSLDRLALSRLCGHAVPLLEEVLELLRGRIGIDVEIKDPGATQGVVTQLRDLWRGSPPLVSSFLPDVLAEVRAREPLLPLGLITAAPLGRGAAADLVDGARSLGVSHLVLYHRLLRPHVVRRALQAGLRVVPWTVNRPGELRRLLGRPDLWALVTDRPTLASRLRREAAGGREEGGPGEG